ncbi:TetR/AcrR family transcriptional regulator [Paenibacillus lentus]|uniref:TetR/AcrR family transcriptional regulator n=1 Tax=Paenibacillus lentus TaxID=1338368 RepID=UPI003659A75A
MKQRVMEAAKEEIIESGLRFTMRDLAARLGVSTKTIYQCFDSKEQIIDEIVTNSILEMKNSEASIMKDTRLTNLGKLKKTLVNLPEWFMLSDIRLLKEFKQRYPKQWAEIDKLVTLGWNQVQVLVEQAVQEGVLRTFNLDLFIQMYIGCLYQLMENRYDRRAAQVPLEQVLDQMVELLLHGIALKE